MVPAPIVSIETEGSDSFTELTPSTVPPLDDQESPKRSIPSSINLDGMDDPICIVGIACRLPGDIRSPAGFWELLLNKKCAQGPVPPERFNINGFHHPDDSRAGVMSATGGYFLNEDVRLFENSFFGINNLEATYMDPLQRKLLEVVFECFENAGISLDQASGSNTGVYTGDFTTDYLAMHFRDPDYLHRYSTTGSGKAILANRISHVFNLQGPSLTLNTACSSSLYCLHTAISAIKAGDCDSAVVAAANLIMSPEQHIETMKGGVLSSTSTCHTFDASADGYGRGEGINAVYIKPLSSAMRDGDKIWGVIRASALNACGRTPGISQPSAALQEAVIRKAYAKAGLSFADTDYVECHGTGTAVGDVIEVDALKQCFSPREGPPLLIGSVKTNLGHSEATSGLTSIIKVLLAFENDMIPPTYGVKKLNPKLDIETANIKVVTETEQWPRSLRRASINSFGYGGANSHVVLECLDSYLGVESAEPEAISGLDNQIFLIPISAGSSRSLETRISHISALVEGLDERVLRNLAFTLAHRRSHLSFKAGVLARVKADGGSEVVQIQIPDTSDSRSLKPLPFAFVFTGQGAQYPCMAKELLLHNSTFNATIQELDSVLQALPKEQVPSWTLREAILDPPDSSSVNKVTHSQPLCTAIQIGIVNILKSWGVCASAVVGHSSGEIAAAYAAGLLSQSEAIIVAYMRGYSVARLQGRGAMLAAGIDGQSAELFIEQSGLKGDVCVACVNSPESVTLSGSLEGIELLSSELKKQGKFHRKLDTGGQAYHSHMMKEIGSFYEALLEPYFGGKRCKSRSLAAQMYSSVGHRSADISCIDQHTNMARHWCQNLEQPVQFEGALKNLASSGDYYFVEIGPHHALKGPIHQTLASDKSKRRSFLYSPSLSRNQPSDLALKQLASSLFLHGHVLNWNEVNDLPSGVPLQPLHNLPPYSWDYSAGLLWHEPRASVELRNRKYIRHELLGSQQLAGNGIDWSWRNILRLNEVPWLRDHKVEKQVVFPAAGYLAIAIEAISQVLELKDQSSISFQLRHVSIRKALIVESENDDEIGSRDFEIHTTLSPRKLSATTTSADWYDFSISTWEAGQTTVHCTGGIRVSRREGPKGTVPVSDSVNYETWSTDRWYDKFEEEGLCYGTQFRPLLNLSTDSNRAQTSAISTTRLAPLSTQEPGMEYAMHPVAIDACFQTAIMGTTKGEVNSLQAYLPVFISECHIRNIGNKVSADTAQIQVRSAKTSVSTQRADCSLRVADDVLADFKGVRLSLYTGKMGSSKDSSKKEPQRNPCLRVHWKPDILRLHPGAEVDLNRYMEEYVKGHGAASVGDETLAMIGALVDLAGHRNPGMQVLELGRSCDCKSEKFLDLLDMDTAFPRCSSWQTGTILDNGEFSIEDERQSLFDTVVIPGHAAAERCWEHGGSQLLSVVRDHGVIISYKTDEALRSLDGSDFTVIHVGQEIILATRTPRAPSILEGRSVLLVFQKLTPHIDKLISFLKSTLKRTTSVAQVSGAPLSEIHTAGVDENTICISLLEVETEFLATMVQDDMDRIRSMTNVVTNLLWITGTNTLGVSGESDPNLTLASGLSRALMVEQPSLRFSIVDIGKAHKFEQDAQAICDNLIRALIPFQDNDDKEFVYSKGLLHISRFGPDPALNSLFRRRLGMEEQLRKATLESAGLARLAIDKVGRTDTIYFQMLREHLAEPPAGFVDISVKAVGLNAKDVYTLGGYVKTRLGTTSCEFSGIVTAVATDVTNVQPGDRVVVMLPSHFRTVERVPSWTVHKLLPDEEYTTMATIPVAFSTAFYALHDRAHLQRGESILIHAASGALGIAAIGIAQSMGAVVFATAGSQAKKDFLMEKFGLPASHIFSSRDMSFVDGVMVATEGRGVDVILNSLVGDLMHASWSCVANFGRFVEVGKRELVDAGALDMNGFLRNATFTAFDMEEIIFSENQAHRDLVSRKMREALELYRLGKMKLPPITTFDIGDISQAYRFFSTKDRVGKVVISLENPASQIQVFEPKYSAIFDPEKVYLLVGCLGGLGRSLSRWMLVRGARNFVFLGRSGCDKLDAQKLVSRLQDTGANVVVVRGDVSVASDVHNAVRACEATGKRLGGVVQAAMGLKEAIFSQMTSEAWHIGVDCKWAGTWNLHIAIQGHDESLDFFLMTSSNSGSVGVATEANYCASNGFLDAFARWRHSQGKPAVSVGLGMISEVGYLHENPDIEAILIRRGVQAMPEDEFLQLIDLAISGDGKSFSTQEDASTAHILTGLESVGFRKLLALGFDVNNLPMQDPRSRRLAESLALEQKALVAAQGGADNVGRFGSAMTNGTTTSTPNGINGIMAADVGSRRDAILQVIRRQFSNLILIPAEKIEDFKPLAQFGVDSMLAAEFRTWFWATFEIDIPFLDLVSSHKSLDSLASVVEAKLSGSSENDARDDRDGVN